jgi:hypothetical protein
MLVYQTALISGGAASILAVVITRLIERFGGVIGGVAGSLPTTIVIAAAGFYSTLDDEALKQALYVVPLGMLVDGGVLACWRTIPFYLPTSWTPRTCFLITLASSLVFWATFAASAYLFVTYALLDTVNYILYAGVVALFLNILLGLKMSWKYRAAPRGDRPVSWAMLLARGLFAGIRPSFAPCISARSLPSRPACCPRSP